jgi:hypothetical protein
MSAFTVSLFAPQTPLTVGVGYHNVGSGVLRASHADMIKKISAHYGERCGHLPLDAEHLYVLVALHSPTGDAQIAYLSALLGKTVHAVTETELQEQLSQHETAPALFVPYINVSQTDSWVRSVFGGESWGLPSAMVDILKNKASFYNLLDEFDLADWRAPEYCIAQLIDLPQAAHAFLAAIETLLSETGLNEYPLGVMLRAAESDGNYGCCLLYEERQRVALIPNGEATSLMTYPNWQEALLDAQQILEATMDLRKESRIVLSRYIDLADSPGLSLVLLNGEVVSLRWNGQLQEAGSKACVGTGSYRPRTEALARLRDQYEPQTVAWFTTLLQNAARHCGIDFSTIRGLANIDIMIPSPLELELQRRRGQRIMGYIAECNPRWTNYTDAIMSVIGANRQAPTAQQMLATIDRGILAVDKYKVPIPIDTQQLRARIAEVDQSLQADGTRIICRMATHPLGVIFAGDVARAQQELARIIAAMS